jgi:hypothetical protein
MNPLCGLLWWILCSWVGAPVKSKRYWGGTGKMRDWLLHRAIETDEKTAADLAGPGYHINRSNLLVLESKADMQKRGQASPDDGDALALTFAQPVEPAEVEEEDDEEAFGRYTCSSNSGWMR